jgi:hypothetical protein
MLLKSYHERVRAARARGCSWKRRHHSKPDPRLDPTRPKEPFGESCGCKRESHNHWLGMTCYDSLRLNAKLLDERPPFLRVGTLQRAERLGGLPLAGKNLEPEIDQARSHCGIGQRLDGRRI